VEWSASAAVVPAAWFVFVFLVELPMRILGRLNGPKGKKDKKGTKGRKDAGDKGDKRVTLNFEKRITTI